MRGVGHTLSRLHAARAFIAGAAILSGSVPAGVVRAAAVSEDTAFANPRIGADVPGGGLDGAGLPQPLAPSDATRLRHVFALLDAGRLDAAAFEMGAVSDAVLTGHVLAQRYLDHHGHATEADLATWLAQYADHPDSAAIHALLLSRLPIGAPRPASPEQAMLPPDPPEAAAPEEGDTTQRGFPRNPLLDRTVHERARAGNADSALHLLRQTKGLDALYTAGNCGPRSRRPCSPKAKTKQALRLAQGASCGRLSGQRRVWAGYVGGLGSLASRPTRCRRPAIVREPRAAPRLRRPTSLRAGAAFWTARANLRNARPRRAIDLWMRQAADRAAIPSMGCSLGASWGSVDTRPASLPATRFRQRRWGRCIDGQSAQGRRALRADPDRADPAARKRNCAAYGRRCRI